MHTLRLGTRCRHRLTSSTHKWLLPLNLRGRGDHREIEATGARCHPAGVRPGHGTCRGTGQRVDTGQGDERSGRQDPARRGHPGGRLTQPVHLHHPNGYGHPACAVRVPDDLQPGQHDPGRASLAEKWETSRRQAHLDVPLPQGREVVGRRAGDREGRGVHVQQDVGRRDRADRQRQLRHAVGVGQGDRRPDAGDQDQGAAGDHGRPRHPDRAGAHLVEGDRRRRRADVPDGRQRAVLHHGVQRSPVHQDEGQQELLARRSQDRRAPLHLLPQRRRGRDRAAERPGGPGQPAHPDAVRRAEERPQHRAEQRTEPPVQRDRDQPGRRHQRRHADRQRQPRAEGRQAAAGDRAGDRLQDADRQGVGRLRHRGRRLHPAGVQGLRVDAAGGQEAQVRPRRGQQGTRRGRVLQEGRRRRSGSTRPASR